MDDLLALIVEDHQDSAVIFANALQEAGFEVEIVPTGDAALARLAITTPTVVVLDLELPRVSGGEILCHIRADVRLAETHVIVATAFPEMARDLEEKVDLVLVKPVGYRLLRDLAGRYIGENTEEASTETSLALEGKGETILFVDDEGKLRDVVQRVLTLLGYRVLTAADGQDLRPHRQRTSPLDRRLRAAATRRNHRPPGARQSPLA